MQGRVISVTYDFIRARSIFYKSIFELIVIPFLKEHDLSMVWAMGGVAFIFKDGKSMDTWDLRFQGIDKALSSPLKKSGITCCVSPLWELMSDLQPSGRYHLDVGFMKWEDKADEKSIEERIKKSIESMSHEDMCRRYRFSKVGDPFFDCTKPYHEIFMDRFKSFGGMTTEMSKKIGNWLEFEKNKKENA